MKAPHEIALIVRPERLRAALLDRLAASGFDRTRAYPGPEALAAEPDGPEAELLIMDVDSGGAPGFSMLEAARALPRLKRAKTVVITRSRDMDTLDVALGSIDAVLVIPFKMGLFLETVAEHLGEDPPVLPETAASPPESATGPARPVRDEAVLVVDDSSSMRHIVREYLGRLGFSRVKSASGYKEADALLSAERFGLILSDLKMPGRSGMELLDRVRRDPAHANTPFVLITSDSRVENAFAAGRHGATAFLPKPFTVEDMDRVVSAALGR